MKKIILASSSPRRREILDKMGLDFEVIPSDYEEILENDDFTYEKIEELAYNKAKAVLDKHLFHHRSIVLSADTVVVLDEKILGKPQNEIQAADMLKSLSGKRHCVVTCICLINPESGNKKFISTTSYVEFEELSDKSIKQYIKNYAPLDKAGAYGIQELPDGFIKAIEGSFENIVGLCPKALNEALLEFKS